MFDLRSAALAAGLAFATGAAAQTYGTSFEAPEFAAGDVAGQNGWGHLSNSPTKGVVEALPPGSPAVLGTQGLALRTRDVGMLGVSNHLYSPLIDPPAGETGAVAEGVPAPVANDYFFASFWYRTPSAPVISTTASGRIAELNPSTKGPDPDQPANRYAQVRIVNNTNTALGLVRVDIAWLTPAVTVVDNLAWGEWFRFEYAIRTVDGDFGATPNDLFTLRVFDAAGTLISSTAASTCGSTWEMGYKGGGFGGGPGPRQINGFDFWSTTGPNDTLVGYIDGIEYSSQSLPDPSLQLAAGNNQQALPGAMLPAPLAVTVANAPADHARCYPVTYAVQSAPPGAVGAAVGTPVATPDAGTGAASSSATLGDLPGTYIFSASSPLLAGGPVLFEAQAFTPAPALAIDKVLSSAPASIVAGSVLGYTVTATNTGNVALTDVTVADAQLDTPDTACANLAVGASCVLAGNHVVTAAEAQAGTVDNTAIADSGETAAVQDALSTPTARADLSLLKSDTGADFLPGGSIAYTLAVSNDGPDAAEQLQLTDVLPAGLQFVSATGAGWACGFAAGTVSCTRASLAPGATAPVTLLVSVDVGFAGASITNTASVTNAAHDPVPGNDADSETTDAAQPGLALQKVLTTSPQYRVAGSVLGYTVTATNTGNIALTGVTVSDPLLGGPGTACATLAVNATCVLTGDYVVTAADVQAGVVNNTATADSQQTSPVQASLSTPIARAGLALTKDDGGVDFIPGGALDYTLSVSNAGPDAAEALTLTDTLPAGLQFVSAGGAGWACGFAAGTVTCTRAALAAGASSAVVLSVDVAPGFADASITNTASVASAVADPVPDNNADSETTSAIQGGGPADLRVAKVADAAAVSPGATIAYTLTITNTGVATALGTVLTDATPAGLVFVDASAPCAAGFPCALGDLPNGATQTVTARYAVPPGQPAGAIANTASATASTPDPTPADNTATANVMVNLVLPVMPRLQTIPANDRAALLLLVFGLLAVGGLARLRMR